MVMVAEPVLVAVELSFIVNLVMLLMGIYTREPPRRSLHDCRQAGERLAAFSWTQDKPESRAPLSPRLSAKRRAPLLYLFPGGEGSGGLFHLHPFPD